MTPVTISQGAETFVSLAIAFGVYILLLGIKAFFQWLPWPRGGVWTNCIPGWAWVVIACLISVAVCVVFKINQIGALIEQVIPLPYPWMGWIATGAVIGTSSNVMYKVLTPIGKKLKDARTGKVICYPPGVALPTSQSGNTTTQNGNVGQESQQTSKDAGVSIQPEVSTPEKSIPVDSTRVFDGQLYLLTPVPWTEPVWITGPSDSSPTHILIPAGWNRSK